jgi:hypothetical protein
MHLLHSTFVSDVAVVYRPGVNEGYGSGRLIAPGLVLTSAHVIQEDDGSVCLVRDWNVVLLRDSRPGAGWGRPHKARVVWTGKDGLDMAVLQVQPASTAQSLPVPVIAPIYASYDQLQSLEVHATGFPEAWRDEARTRDLTVSGTLWVSTRDGPYTWIAVLHPDRREGWKGMSGATVCLPGDDGRVYLFGVVQQVPANFSGGTLDVARVSNAIADDAFRRLVEDSTGTTVSVVPFSIKSVEVASARAHVITLRSRFPALVDGTSGNLHVKLEAFLAEYLLRPSAPLKFLGRGGELDSLDSWLSRPDAPPYYALVGPAGRGKSALAVQWAARVAERGEHDVVLLPISARFDLIRPDELLKLLAIRLCYLEGKELDLDSSPDRLVDEIHAILASDRQLGNKPLLVIIDGWDEAQNPKWLRLPQVPGKGVQILVCSRLLVGEVRTRDALHRIGIPASAAHLQLPPLSRHDLVEGIVDLEDWTPGIGDWLWRLSDGDPLLVRLYLDWIADHRESGQAMLKLELEPDRVEVGLARYMRTWWDETQAAAGTTGSDHVKRLLHAVALARSPLSSEDLAEIAELDPLDVSTARVPLSRLMVGDGLNVGYAFSHPRIAEFVVEELMTAKTRAAMEERYFVHCLEAARSLKAGVPGQKPVSRYVLSFCIDHFERHGAAVADYANLLSAGWMRARHALDGHYSGFVGDMLRIREIALRADAMQLATACALARAAVVTLSSGVPAELLRMAVQEGLITGNQAVEEISAVRSPRARAVALAAVADSLDESAAVRAVEIAWNTPDREDRLLALAGLSARLASSRDALASDLQDELQHATGTMALLLRTTLARLGYENSTPLTKDHDEQLNDELRDRIWAASQTDDYIRWAGETAQVLEDDARKVFVHWVVRSVGHRIYKWHEHDHAEQLVRAIADYVAANDLTTLEVLLEKGHRSSGEGRAYLLARRMTVGDLDCSTRISEALHVENPWTCVPLLPHMDKASARQWAQRCLSDSAEHVPERRWQDIFKCLPYAGRGEFVKLAWRRIRKVQNVYAVRNLAPAMLPRMAQEHRAQIADQFLERLKDVDRIKGSDIALVAREASPEGLLAARKRIGTDQKGLIVLIGRLDPDERRGLLGSILDMRQLPTDLVPLLAECLDAVPEYEREALAIACLDRITGMSSAWLPNRAASLLHAELIEALAPRIISILGNETIPVLRGAAEQIEIPSSRALALSTLAGCSSGDSALKLAMAALSAYFAEGAKELGSGWSPGTYDVRAALSIVSDHERDAMFASVQTTQNVGQLLRLFRKEQAASISGQVARYWDSGDHDAIVRLLDSLCAALNHDIGEFFETLGRLVPVRDPWVRQLWARGMEAASVQGHDAVLFYLAKSAPGIRSVLDDNELKEVVEAVLDVSSWEWQ